MWGPARRRSCSSRRRWRRKRKSRRISESWLASRLMIRDDTWHSSLSDVRLDCRYCSLPLISFILLLLLFLRSRTGFWQFCCAPNNGASAQDDDDDDDWTEDFPCSPFFYFIKPFGREYAGPAASQALKILDVKVIRNGRPYRKIRQEVL